MQKMKLISNVMPATGLKIVGHVYHGVAFPSSFQNSLKMSGHRGYEFRCWNLVS